MGRARHPANRHGIDEITLTTRPGSARAGWAGSCFCGWRGMPRATERLAQLDAGKHLARELLDDVRRRHDPDRDPLGYLGELRHALNCGELGVVLDTLRSRRPRRADDEAVA